MSESNNKPKLSVEQLQQLAMLQQQMAGKQLTKRQAFMQKLISNYFQKMQQLVHYLDRFINFTTKKEDSERNDVLQAARPPILFGTYVIIAFVGFGGLWSAIAPLDSATVAVGTVISSTNKKIINHAEGGIIKNIFVNQGDIVKEGDKLIELEDTKVKSQYESTINQYRTALATQNRLIAERDGLDDIEFDEFLKASIDVPEVEKILHTQEHLFRSQKEGFRTEKESLKQKIAQLEKEIEGTEARKVSAVKNLEIFTDRLKATKTLMDKGFAHKTAVLELESKEATAKSEIAQTETQIAKLHQEITRSEIEIINLENRYMTKTLSDLKDAQVNVSHLKEQYFSLADSLSRMVIKSPVDGIVNVLNIHTIGGAISPTAPILEISPVNDTLIIEARVASRNIDSVHTGLVAKIRFSAFKSRTTPLFTGKVVAISPDIVQDRNNQFGQAESVYIARIEIDMDEFNKIAKAKKLELHPGMQAEVQIVTGTRTLLRYLLDPVIDTMFKAFKEK